MHVNPTPTPRAHAHHGLLDYRGSGFRVRDYQAEVWLHLLAQEAAAVTGTTAWLANVRTA